MPLGTAKEPTRSTLDRIPPARARWSARYARRSGRDLSAIDWYDVFAALEVGAIVLEGSYAKFQRGESDKPMHEFFGSQADLLLESAAALVAGTSGAPT